MRLGGRYLFLDYDTEEGYVCVKEGGVTGDPGYWELHFERLPT